MKSLLIVVITLLFAVPSFGYHFDWHDNEGYSGLETLDDWGTLSYSKEPGIPYDWDKPYHEAPDWGQAETAFFRLDEGDSLSSLTTISFNINIQIDSSVPTNNLSGDVFIYHDMDLAIFELTDRGSQLVYESVYDEDISHSLGDSGSLSFAWTHEYAFIPDKEYAIANFLSLNAFMDSQVNDLVREQDRDDEYFSVNVDWEGTADISFVHTPVPEPSTLLLLGSGMAGLVFFYRRKRD